MLRLSVVRSTLLLVFLVECVGLSTLVQAQTGTPPLTPEQQKRLAEWPELQKRIDGLVGEGKLAEATKA